MTVFIPASYFSLERAQISPSQPRVIWFLNPTSFHQHVFPTYTPLNTLCLGVECRHLCLTHHIPFFLPLCKSHFLPQCMKVKSESEVTQSCLTLSDPMDCSLPGSSIHGIFQARVLATRKSRGPHGEITEFRIVHKLFSLQFFVFTYFLPFLLIHMRVLVTQSCPTRSNPVDRSPPGSSVHGIVQARVLERVPSPSPPVSL